MLARGRRIGVAVSGGADSVFLLHALAEAGLAVAVLHVNHGLRGEESDQDEQFVRGLAGKRGLPFHGLSAPVAAGNVEQEARRARYVFFESVIAGGICDSVATGHTKDDQAETVLGRFLRGSGTAGLSGILPVTREGIIRPLLDLRRLDIRDFLREGGVPWQEDCSNQNTAFLRNRIRIQIMPQLAAINPSISDVLASCALWARDEEDYWQGELQRFETEHVVSKGDAILVRTGDIRTFAVAAQRRIVRFLIERARGNLRSIDFRHVEAVRNLIQATEGSGRLQLPDLDIYRSFDWLRFAPIGFDTRLERDFSVPLTVPGTTAIAERGLAISVHYSQPVYNNNEVNALDQEKCAGSLQLRNWRPGDRLHPAGYRSAEKLKTLFQEHRIPLWERRHWPVIVRDSSLLWTRRFGADRAFAAGPESEQILLVRETGESNPANGTSIETYGLSAEIENPRQGSAKRHCERKF